MTLNSTQSKLLDILRDRSSSFTLDELAAMLNLSNRSSVHYNIQKLIKLGYLKVNPANSSDYIVLDQQDKGLFYLPLYSGAKCGPKGRLIPEFQTTEIPIPSLILKFDVSNALAMKTEGDSMEYKIPEGSVVIVNRSETKYEPNQTFLVIHDNTPKIKNLFYDTNKKYYILSSYNPTYLPFIASPKELSIVGKVRAIINNI
jgi:SOS-response transcriptional repressor LexA